MPEPEQPQQAVNGASVQRRQRIISKRGVKPYKARVVLENLQLGNSLVVSCERAGINPATFWRWRQKHKVLDRAVFWAIEGRTSVVEDALYKTATEGNVTAQIFYLTNKNPDVWKDRRNLMHGIVSKKAGEGDANLTDREKQFLAGIESELEKGIG